jgi:hypothetical protein
MYNLHTCITYTWAILFTSNMQNNVMHRIVFYWFVWMCTKYTALCKRRGSKGQRPSRVRAVPDVFGNHRSHLYSDHAKFSDLTDLIDHRESDLDLRFTVNPDGRNWPVGVGCVTTSSIPIDRKHCLNYPHVQLISSTVCIADLINDNISHMPLRHIKYASNLNPNPIAEALIPLLVSMVGASAAI